VLLPAATDDVEVLVDDDDEPQAASATAHAIAAVATDHRAWRDGEGGTGLSVPATIDGGRRTQAPDEALSRTQM
jgi:hypothetical protein